MTGLPSHCFKLPTTEWTTAEWTAKRALSIRKPSGMKRGLSVENICTMKRLLKLKGLLTTFPAISSQVVSGKSIGLSMHPRVTYAEELGTTSKNNFRGITLGVRSLWGIRSLTLTFYCMWSTLCFSHYMKFRMATRRFLGQERWWRGRPGL